MPLFQEQCRKSSLRLKMSLSRSRSLLQPRLSSIVRAEEDMYRLLDVEFRYERGLIDRVLQLEIENKELQDRLEHDSWFARSK